ncbi:MAG TPA: two-component regulator propeller domain-containing protein, partial [Candidatus Acidoferrum sp.]|nr:two-component regulator propeller domain-containing protein [Candidatus Acidoferrum sp.]
MRSRTTSAVLCLGLLATGLDAQRYSFKRYDQDSGLPSQSIRCMLQDRLGLLWIATDNGLYRYDGHSFRSFTTDDGLPAARIEALHQTRDGTLWVGTFPGLARLKGERFEIVDTSPGRGALALASDATGRLYVGTGKGLLIADSAGASTKPNFRMITVPGARSQVVRSIAISPSGEVWYSCSTLLCRLEGGRAISRAEWGVPPELWHSLAIDSHGSVWARSTERLIELPAGESRFRRRDADLPPATSHSSLLVGQDGRLWAPTIRGLAHLTPAGWDIIGKARGLPTSSVHCMLEDREGSLWIGLNGGGLMRALGYPYWESWTEGEGLSSESVWVIRRDRKGALWNASDSGVSRFNEARQRWEDLKVPGLPAAQTTALAFPADGSLWVGQVTGAVHVDPLHGSARPYGQESGLRNPWITSLAVDPEGGIWACTPNGLHHSVSSRGSIRFERRELSLEPGAEFFYDCLVDRKGRLWMAGWAGLLRLEDGRLTRYTTRDGLLQNRAQHIAEGKDGSIWVAYSDALGVSQLTPDGAMPQWRHFALQDGLRSLKVFSLGSDVRGWIWSGTDRGVDVFDGRGWRHFDHTDGLSWDDCNGNAFLADPDGSVWIGTARGISHFRIPASGLPQRPTAAPTIWISALFGDRSMGLHGPVSVAWPQRSLAASFSAMTFVNEDTVRFRYRIAGLEDRWNETPLREVHLPGLLAGSYTLEVQANAGQGAWDPVTARLAFQIRPAWWRTWWFDLAAMGTAA